MKLGEHRTLRNDDHIKEIWLTKWKPTKEYQVWGLIKNQNGKVEGWAVLHGGTLKECRQFAETL